MASRSSSTGNNPAEGYIHAGNTPTAASICCVALNCDRVFTSRAQMLEHKRTAHNTPENIHPGTHYVCPVPGCHQGQLILRSDYPGPGRFDEFRRHFREDHPRLCDSLEPWVLDAIYASVRAQSDMSADTVNLERKTLEVREKVRKIREKEVEMDRLQVGLLRAAAGGFLGAGAPQAPM